MTKLLFTLIIATLLTACSTVQTSKQNNPRILGPYHVEGNGKTIDEAKSDAFKKAIEQAVGVAVMSERAVKNKELVRQYVLTHSNGYVERYEILEKRMVGSQHKLQVEVYIRTGTMVDDYALYRSNSSNEFDGQQAGAMHETYQKSFESGNQMLATLLADFPEKAFDLEILPITTFVDKNGRSNINLLYHIQLSSNYMKSLSNLLNQLKGPDCFQCPGVVIGYYDKPDDYFLTTHKYSFKESTKPAMLYNTFWGTRSQWGARFFVRVEFKDREGKTMMYTCHRPAIAMATSDGNIYQPPRKFEKLLELTDGFSVGMSPEKMGNLGNIEFQVVDINKCS